MSTNPQEAGLFLTGECLSSEDVLSVEAGFEPGDIRPGDIKIFTMLDAAGRRAVQGGHTNFGYSGYVSASVFDGTRWRRFDLRSISAASETRYQTQSGKSTAMDNAQNAVKNAEGRVVQFRIPEGRKREIGVALQPSDELLQKDR